MREWESEFIALWQQGCEVAEIATRLGIPRGTVSSRASALTREGKIQRRPRGGAYPQQKALARQEDRPAPPAASVPPASPAAPAPPAMTFVAVPEIQEMLGILKDLQARVGELEQARVAPALPAPPVSPATPTTPAPERKDIQQWTVRLSKALIEHLKGVAYERRIHPSELVEDWLRRQAQTDRSPPPSAE